MTLSSKKKYILYGILAIVALGTFFYFYSNRSSEQVTVLQSPDGGMSSGASIPGNDFSGSVDQALNVNSGLSSAGSARIVRLLLELQRVSFSQDIFADTRFKSLEDHSVTLAPETAGRSLPFAPVGVGGKPGSATTVSTSTTTSSSTAPRSNPTSATTSTTTRS